MKDDTIYRQAAIDALESEQSLIERPITETRWFDLGMRKAHEVLSKLPSAQPEIIRCKDCKHKHIENMIWTCPFGLPGGELFFCAYGAERRTDE